MGGNGSVGHSDSVEHRAPIEHGCLGYSWLLYNDLILTEQHFGHLIETVENKILGDIVYRLMSDNLSDFT